MFTRLHVTQWHDSISLKYMKEFSQLDSIRVSISRTQGKIIWKSQLINQGFKLEVRKVVDGERVPTTVSDLTAPSCLLWDTCMWCEFPLRTNPFLKIMFCSYSDTYFLHGPAFAFQIYLPLMSQISVFSWYSTFCSLHYHDGFFSLDQLLFFGHHLIWKNYQNATILIHPEFWFP